MSHLVGISVARCVSAAVQVETSLVFKFYHEAPQQPARRATASFRSIPAVFPHLVFVEFQYTTCLLATAAEIMLKRKIVAFQAGRAPGVRTGEPIVSAAGPGRWRGSGSSARVR